MSSCAKLVDGGSEHNALGDDNITMRSIGMMGKELAALRRRVGLSQAALAGRVGVSRQTVSYWEGKPALDGRMATLKKLAEALHPDDRKMVLNSRPGLGFIALHFAAPVLPEQLELVFTAMAVRKATLFEGRRRTCGAKTRRGKECQLKSQPGSGRCRLHGGLSTGPKTVEGRARIAEAQRKRWAERREDKQSAK